MVATVEPASVKLSLDYAFVVHTDIVDCYSAIYTHSIAWALHTKQEAQVKAARHKSLGLANAIDTHFRHIATQGPPANGGLRGRHSAAGSTLMDS